MCEWQNNILASCMYRPTRCRQCFTILTRQSRQCLGLISTVVVSPLSNGITFPPWWWSSPCQFRGSASKGRRTAAPPESHPLRWGRMRRGPGRRGSRKSTRFSPPDLRRQNRGSLLNLWRWKLLWTSYFSSSNLLATLFSSSNAKLGYPNLKQEPAVNHSNIVG